MNIILHGKNIELTPSIKAYVDEKLGHVAKVLGTDSGSIKMDVEIGRPSAHHLKGLVHYAEVNLSVGGMIFRATAEHEDVHTAIDKVRDEVERQIRKFKTKKQAARRKARD
ncbi:MAG: ribosomal subunit interface protein [Candidatus Yanofskybacteria bacterium RIFCSPLOWO2_01_FULL_49_25]|uniref:Ribosomal subunit interface protein n=1 Tax=Candidatus Yanofskybacteria bacterium RIFCSPLOWO2_01_FULL_49_25 TaxID=1802701 RepID=A0A1F8GZG1_9BACT|nr:MAG: ribosomal subunit interface protein [Candidatus Yanofskybacteria bacterium RIFCSPLOWO2_01_FULL_49_25]